MNFKMIFHMLGKIITLEGALMVLPLLVALLYREQSGLAFLAAVLLALAVGLILVKCFKPKNKTIYAKEGFIVVALTWVICSLIGALPFYISREIPSFVDALFESVSGFTTTGASVVPNVELLSHGILFWRSFTHWIGGMGVLVLLIALLPSDSGRTIHILRAEMPGPVVGKLVPKARDTAKILYLIYLVMTVVQIVLLWLGDMNLFEAMVHTFGTAGTGGFGIRANSIAGYSAYSQWVIAVFMILFGINFNLYYMMLLRHFKTALKSEELWFYLGVIFVSVVLVFVNIYGLFAGTEAPIRHAVFQVASIITTTGYATTDFTMWSGFSKGILLLLMIIGGCAGSTAGGFKVSRVVLLGKSIRQNIRQLLHPHSVGVVRMEGKRVDDDTLNGVNAYLAVYCVLLGGIFLLLCLEPFSLETNLTSAISCFNNVGPAFGDAAANYSIYSPGATLLLSAAMLLGRLEIFPLLIIFLPLAWRRK